MDKIEITVSRGGQILDKSECERIYSELPSCGPVRKVVAIDGKDLKEFTVDCFTARVYGRLLHGG